MAETDEEICARIKDALASEPLVADLDVVVESRVGVVFLRGEVDTEAQVARATEVARAIPGVVTVRNQLVSLRLGGVQRQAEVIWVRRRPVANTEREE